MEASGAVLQRAPGTAGDWRLCGRRTRRVLGEGFTDAGTMKYSVSCGAKKEEKKRAKLVKRLEKDLSAFYSMSPVVEPGVGLNEDPKTRMISDAANLLLTKLKELRAEEKQMKRRRKEEKAKSMTNRGHNESSSSSSSESSDSECETIVKLSKAITEPKSTLERRLMQQREVQEIRCIGSDGGV